MKILFIQFAAIGDVLMCTPALRMFRRNYPEADISFIVDIKAYDAIKHNPHIDNIIVANCKRSLIEYILFLRKALSKKYDIIIDFQRNPRSALVSFLTFARKRISFRSTHRNFVYNIKVPAPDINLYAGIRKLHLLKPLNINDYTDYFPEMYISNEDMKWADLFWKRYNKDDFVIALSPVSRKEHKRWQLENFSRLCDFLIDNFKANILFTWGPNERECIDKIINLMHNKIKIDYEINTITKLYALFEKSDILIGNDNGPRHIAMTAGIPTIGIFGHKYPTHWTPPNYENHIIIKGNKIGIKNLTYKQAFNQIEPIVKKFYEEKQKKCEENS